jgi:UPF0716 protein FxsA
MDRDRARDDAFEALAGALRDRLLAEAGRHGTEGDVHERIRAPVDLMSYARSVWLLVPIVVLPLIEVWFILAVSAPLLGWPLTLLALCCTSLLGAHLLKREGKAVWLQMMDALRLGRVPYNEFADGLLIAFGAALMLAPGFVSDILGLILLAPVTRRPLRRLVIRLIERQAFSRMVVR